MTYIWETVNGNHCCDLTNSKIQCTQMQYKCICIAPFNIRAIQSALCKTKTSHKK